MTTPFSFGASAFGGTPKSPGALAEPAVAPDMMQLLTQLLQGQQQQQQNGPDIAALLQQIQGAKDPVGQYNNRSNLPSNATGSTSPFATGFFKPMDQAFGPPAVPPATADMSALLKKKKPTTGGFGAGAY